MGDGTEPIEDDELLYRRVRVDDFDPEQDKYPPRQAFHPSRHDDTGVSVFRAKYTSLEEAARNDRGKQYYVAVFCAGDLRKHGIEIVPRPEFPDQPGHAELPGMTYASRKEDQVKEWEQLLAQKLCFGVEGPLPKQ